MLLNSEEAVLACILARQYIFDELIQMGLRCEMFTGGNVNLFNMIVKYRVENKVDAIIITNLPIDAPVQSSLLDIMNDTQTYEYPQYFQQLEKGYIGREKTRILTAYGDTRKDCLKVAGHLIVLAESGQITEEDLATTIEETVKRIVFTVGKINATVEVYGTSIRYEKVDLNDVFTTAQKTALKAALKKIVVAALNVDEAEINADELFKIVE